MKMVYYGNIFKGAWGCVLIVIVSVLILVLFKAVLPKVDFESMSKTPARVLQWGLESSNTVVLL
jgi:hypothetical protein